MKPADTNTNHMPERIFAKVHGSSTDVISGQRGLIGGWNEHQRDGQTEFVRFDLVRRNLQQEVASAAGVHHGPFGHIVGRRDLREDEWSLENDPVDEDDAAKGFFSVPLYALTDPFKEIGIEGLANAASLAARELALVEGDLNARLKAKGMYSIDEMMGSLPLDKWRVHSGMTDLKFFGEWLERKTREYCTMRAAYAVGDKDGSDELYEWVLAHYGAFHDVLVNFRAALSSPDHADAGKVEGDGWLPTHRHKKRGSTYQVIAEGRLQVDGDLDNERVVIYRGEDGQHWARPAYEFNDGRFETLPSAPASEGAE